MADVFSAYDKRDRNAKTIKQTFPAVHVYGWVPNRAVSALQQPHEKGTWFTRNIPGSPPAPAPSANPGGGCNGSCGGKH